MSRIIKPIKIIQVGSPLVTFMGKYHQLDAYIATSFLKIDMDISSQEKKGYNVCLFYDVQVLDLQDGSNETRLKYRCKFLKTDTPEIEVKKSVEEEMIL